MLDGEDEFFEDVACVLPLGAEDPPEVAAEVPAEGVAVDAPVVEADAPLDGNPDEVEKCLPPKRSKRASVPNYKSEEVVATVWAFIAMSGEEQIQTMAAQLGRLERMYLPKAKELQRLGRWPSPASRTPEESAGLRAKNPQSLHARAKKAIEVIVNTICPIWYTVKREQQSGWGKEDFVRETKQR